MPRTLLVIPIGLALAAPAAGQWSGSDSTAYFASPVSAIREPGFGVTFMGTGLLESHSAPRERPPFEVREEELDELQATASLGGTLRLWRPLTWDGGGLVLGLHGGVFARIRVEVSSNDLMATDWTAGIPAEAKWGPWSARLTLLHWSSHLGDEFIADTGAERIDYSFEAFELLVARELGPVRVWGGGSRTVDSTLENGMRLGGTVSDAGEVRAGIDVRLPLESPTPFVGGLEWYAADRSDWSLRTAATAGVSLRTLGRDVVFQVRVMDGPSALGEFFLTDESYWGLEMRIR